jgi:hypothetical protein
LKDSRDTLTLKEQDLMEHFKKTYATLSKSREVHRLKLKPSLANLKAENLEDLEDAEIKRLEKVSSLIKSVRSGILSEEKRVLQKFVVRVINACHIMHIMFDSLLHPSDNVPDDARPPARRTLKHLMRHQTREQNSSPPEAANDSGLERRKFLTLKYAGLKLSHKAVMKEIGQIIKKDDVECSKIVSDGSGNAIDVSENVISDINPLDGMDSSPDITSFKNRCNKVAIRTRQQIYEGYVNSLRSRLHDVFSQIRFKQQEERTWSEQFAQLCAQMKEP